MDARLAALYARADQFFDAAVRAAPAAFACRAGCDACCRADLTVWGVEAASLREAFGGLAASTRASVVDRARRGLTCVFRDPDAGTCDVYAARPLICRTHGLAVLADGRLDACPLNYRQVEPERAHVLDLERVNQPLALVNRLTGYDASRVSLRGLVLGEVTDG